MEYKIYLPTNISIFKTFLENEDLLLGASKKKEKKVYDFFSKNFSGEIQDILSPQYEVNFQAVKELRRLDPEWTTHITGIYYGNDTCEFLCPMLSEVEEAYELFVLYAKKHRNRGLPILTIVTPSTGEKILQDRLVPIIDFLDKKSKLNKKKIEIVVNDFGVLKLINQKENKYLVPIFGRLLHKLLKTPLLDTYGNRTKVPSYFSELSQEELDEKQKEIVANQNEFLQSYEGNLSSYKTFLKRNGVERLQLDYLLKRGKLYDGAKNIDLNYPYAFIFTGRLCDSCSIGGTDYLKGSFATDTVCDRVCNKFELSPKIKTIDYSIIQKGNSGFMTQINLNYLGEDFIKEPTNRLIFRPFL